MHKSVFFMKSDIIQKNPFFPLALHVFLCYDNKLYEFQIYTPKNRQQTRNEILSPKRGTIYDSTGKALASSVPVDTVSINPSRIKDEIFDLDEMLAFQGETSPYIQYMYVRINSILRKLDKDVLINDVKYDKLRNDLSYDLVKQIYNFNDVLKEVVDKNEPYILSRYLIKLAQTYSDYYNTYKILSDDIDERNSRVYLISIVATL